MAVRTYRNLTPPTAASGTRPGLTPTELKARRECRSKLQDSTSSASDDTARIKQQMSYVGDARTNLE